MGTNSSHRENVVADGRAHPVMLSVVVPTFNRRACLARCLGALRDQSGVQSPWEVIVVDDGSTDGTEMICSRLMAEWPAFRYVRQSHGGPAAARNRGIREARGAVVVFTDDDCVPPPDWLRRVEDWFVREPSLAGVGGVMVTPEEEWLPLSHHSDLARPGEAGWSQFIGTNNAAYRRSVLLAIGGFDERFRHVSVEDAELYIRLRRGGYRTVIDPDLWVYHPARAEPFWAAVRGYVRFWAGYRALEARYPEEFRKVYGASALGVVIKGRSWVSRFRRYRPGMVRHPWRTVKFVCYLAVSRGLVLLFHGLGCGAR